MNKPSGWLIIPTRAVVILVDRIDGPKHPWIFFVDVPIIRPCWQVNIDAMKGRP